MTSNAQTIANIEQQISFLYTTIENLQNIIERLEISDETSEAESSTTIYEYNTPRPSTFLGVYDSENREIHIGDTVKFLSGGKLGSKEGTVYKVSDNKERVTSKDSRDRSISRAPSNLKVIGITASRV